MKSCLKKLYKLFFEILPTFCNSLRSGIPFDSTHRIVGKIRVIKKGWFIRLMTREKNGTLVIGENFKCNNKIKSNSIGLIQPCVFNIATAGAEIFIGDNVGISGATINATKSVRIGNNVLVGSGCLITDTDSHPIDWQDRINNLNEKTISSPVVIEDNVFIGARSIILKGVTIGKNSVIGAGSVVVKSIPENCIAGGNPAKVIKHLD